MRGADEQNVTWQYKCVLFNLKGWLRQKKQGTACCPGVLLKILVLLFIFLGRTVRSGGVCQVYLVLIVQIQSKHDVPESL